MLQWECEECWEWRYEILDSSGSKFNDLKARTFGVSSIICVRSIHPHTDRTARWHWYDVLENNFQKVHRLLGRQLLRGGTSPAPSLMPWSASPTFPRSNSDPALNGNDHDPFCVAELHACFTLSYYPLKMLPRCKNVGNIQGNKAKKKKIRNAWEHPAHGGRNVLTDFSYVSVLQASDVVSHDCVCGRQHLGTWVSTHLITRLMHVTMYGGRSLIFFTTS